MGRRQGRPEDVMPRHVVLGFLESDRLTEDSGVFAMKGMLLCDSSSSQRQSNHVSVPCGEGEGDQRGEGLVAILFNPLGRACAPTKPE